jgi:hypothetical protein
MRLEVSTSSQTDCSERTDISTPAHMFAVNMKKDVDATMTAAPAPSTRTQIWKGTAKVISRLQPAVALYAPNLVAANPIRGRTTCLSTSAKSMANDLFFAARHVEFHEERAEYPCIMSIPRGYKKVEMMVLTWSTLPDRSISSASLLPGLKEEVILTFRTPPLFLECIAPGYWEHEDKVVPTFRGHPTDRPSVPLCFRTRHKPCIHRCGIG